MCAARAAWRRWSATHQSLAVVSELDDLRDWTRAAPVDEANAVLGVLASLTETDGGAVTALVWALLPGGPGTVASAPTAAPSTTPMLRHLCATWQSETRGDAFGRTYLVVRPEDSTQQRGSSEIWVGELAGGQDHP